MNDAILKTVLEAMAEIFKNKGADVPSIDSETKLDQTLGLDSMDFAELVVRLEQAFGFDPFSTGTPPRLQKVGDLVSFYDKPNSTQAN